jgi:uncharacterized membrane protein YczE/MFS family permease
MSHAAVSRLIVPVLGLGMIVSFASSYYLMGVLAEPLAAGVGTSPSVVFTALSGAFLVSAALSPFGGRWIDRRGGREVLSAAAVIFALALTLLGLAREPVVMFAGVLMLGAGMGVGLYGPAYAVLVVLHGEAAKKPIAAVSLLGAFGGALGWPLTLAMIEALGWRGACFVWAGAHLLLCLPLYAAALPDGPGGGHRPASDPVRWNGTMIRLAILFAGAWWVATAMSAHLPRLLTRLGLTPAEAALAAGLMASAAIVVRLIILAAPGKGSPGAGGDPAASARRADRLRRRQGRGRRRRPGAGGGQRPAGGGLRRPAAASVRARELWRAPGPDADARPFCPGGGTGAVRRGAGSFGGSGSAGLERRLPGHVRHDLRPQTKAGPLNPPPIGQKGSMFMRRFIQLQLGLCLYGVAAAMMVRSNLGLDPWNVFHQGLSLKTGMSLGTASIIMGVLVMLAWIPLRQKPGLGTLFNIFVIGLSMDAALAVLPEITGLPLRLAFMTAGVTLTAMGGAAYIGAGMGTGPRDGLMIGLNQRLGWSIRVSRMLIEVSVLVGGWLLGGSVGLGTVVFAVGIGPLIQIFLPWFQALGRGEIQARA